MNRKPWLFAVILIALAALAAALLLRPSAPPPPVSLPPLSPLPITPSPFRSAPGATLTPPISPTPTRKPTPTLGPTPTFYVTLYPYSLNSLEGWSFYTDTQFKIAFPYPAAPPKVYYIERAQLWDIAIGAQWDSTNPWAYASVFIDIWENPDNLPLDSAIAEIERKTGGNHCSKIDAPNPALIESLKRAGAEDAAAYFCAPIPVYVASYQGRIYIFGGGFETESPAQDKILELIIQNIQFLP